MPGGEAPHTNCTVEAVPEQAMSANADAETETKMLCQIGSAWRTKNEQQPGLVRRLKHCGNFMMQMTQSYVPNDHIEMNNR